MLKIRRPLGRLIFNMGIAIPGKTVFLIETAPRMRLSHTPQHTIQNSNVHISVLNGVLWDMAPVHCGICEIALLHWWDMNHILNSQIKPHNTRSGASYGCILWIFANLWNGYIDSSFYTGCAWSCQMIQVMLTSSNGNIFRVTGPLWVESIGHRWIPSQKQVARRLDVFFDLRLNKRLSKQSRRQWFDTLLRSLCHHCYEYRRVNYMCICNICNWPCIKISLMQN